MQQSDKWDVRFMGLAKYISEWSKDPSTKVGAVIVDDEKKIVGLGFNGFPIKTSDNEELYYDRDYKLSKIVHAEINAILFSNKLPKWCTLYTWPFGPCERCAGPIIQSGISRVVFNKTNVDRWIKSIENAKSYFIEANIKISEYE